MMSQDCEDGVKNPFSNVEMIAWCLPMAIAFALGAVFGPSVSNGNNAIAATCVISLVFLGFVHVVERRNDCKKIAELSRINGYLSANVESWRLRKNESRDVDGGVDDAKEENSELSQ